MDAAAKSLIVSFHDVHPGGWSAVEHQHDLLSQWGVPVGSYLVVPEFHHQRSSRDDSSFLRAMTGLEQQGNELVLHGYYHDRVGLAETWRDLFWTRLYTSSEAEFLNLEDDHASRLLLNGKQLFQDNGWKCHGFIAPAWLLHPPLLSLLAKLGFSYTTLLKKIIPLQPGATAIETQSLCYSTRAAWRRAASLWWNPALYQKVRPLSCLRISLHPNDFLFPAIQNQVERLVKTALQEGFVPTTYASYVAR